MFEIIDWLSGLDRVFTILLLLPFLLVGLVCWASKLVHRANIITVCTGIRTRRKATNHQQFVIDSRHLVDGRDLRRIDGWAG